MYKSILFDQVDKTKYPLKSINMIWGGVRNKHSVKIVGKCFHSAVFFSCCPGCQNENM